MSQYMTIMNAIARDIRNGFYPVGGALPSEKELCRQHGVSRTCVRNSLRKLEEDNLIERRQGSGSFVLDAGRREAPATQVGLIVDLKNGDAETNFLSSPAVGAMLNGIKEVLKESRANLTLATYHRDNDDPGEEIDSGFHVDGYIDLGNTISRPLADHFVENESKVVSLVLEHRLHLYDLPFPSVIMDIGSGVEAAFRHYRALGFQRFGYAALAELGLRNFRIFEEAAGRVDCAFDWNAVAIHPEKTDNYQLNLRERVVYLANVILRNDPLPEVIFFDGGSVAEELRRHMKEVGDARIDAARFCVVGSSFDFQSDGPSAHFDTISYAMERAAGEAAKRLLEGIRKKRIDATQTSVPASFTANDSPPITDH